MLENQADDLICKKSFNVLSKDFQVFVTHFKCIKIFAISIILFCNFNVIASPRNYLQKNIRFAIADKIYKLVCCCSIFI